MISTIVGKKLKSSEIINYLHVIYLQVIVLVAQVRPIYLPYRGAILFWFYLNCSFKVSKYMLARLKFLVGSCQTRFSSILL